MHALSRIHAVAAPKTAANAEADHATRDETKVVEIESLMPELTNVVLTSARHMGKNISISYSANDVRIGQVVADHLQDALTELMTILIRRSLETPDVRRERGESGAGHLSVVSKINKGKVDLEVQCTGRDIDSADLEIASWSRLKTLGARVVLGRDNERFKMTLEALPVYALVDRRTPARAALNLEQAS